MKLLQDPRAAMLVMQILTAAFLAILFLQSGLDKLVDRKGNLEWLRGHFAKSPLRNVVPLLLGVITLLELLAGGASAAGVVGLLFGRAEPALLGALLAALALTCLFFGQRVAKDYAGAAGLVPYFILTMFAVSLFQTSLLLSSGAF
jgi:hypothetical protein